MRYVEAGSCRHDFILRYFGDDQETLGGCGHCEECRTTLSGAHPDVTLLRTEKLSIGVDEVLFD